MPAPEIITSRQHPLCKMVRGLDSPRRQREAGLFIASGENAVLAALAVGWPLERLITTRDDTANDWPTISHNANVPLNLVSEAILSYLGDLPSRPEVMALARLPEGKPLALDATGMTLVLDGISDPGNIGTLVRTADAAGVGAIITSENSCDPFGAKAVRASAGSVFRLPPNSWPDQSPSAIAATAQSEKVPIVVGVAHEGENCFVCHWPARCVLVLGHETRGVAAAWETAANARVTIPIFGRAESLNVAAAGAVLMYAWRMRH